MYALAVSRSGFSTKLSTLTALGAAAIPREPPQWMYPKPIAGSVGVMPIAAM